MAGTRGIRIEGGPCFRAADPADTLLRAALRAGIAWPYECSVGGCGNCRFELLEGDVEDLWPQAPGLSARERARGRRLGCQSRPLGEVRVRVRADGDHPVQVQPVRQAVRLVGRRPLTRDLCEFTFQAAAPACFLPGQYALLDLDGVPGSRAYSMSNLPNEIGMWQFIVRHVAGGSGSTALFDRLAVGQEVHLDGPYGHAWLRPPGERQVVCVAGGSGLAPMLSIARAVLARQDGSRVHLYLGVRSQADLSCLQVFAGMDGPGFTLTTVLSEPDPVPLWSGPTGFVHAALERALPAPGTQCEFYFAGPPPMIDAMQDLLTLRLRVPHSQVHFDRFL